MKIRQGAFFLPCSNMSRTRLAPTPTNISTKSEPEIVKKGTLASPAMARASSVLPVPGGPTSSTPFGILPPSRWNFLGVAQVLDDLLKFLLGLVDAGDVVESHSPLPLRQQTRARLAEAHGLAAARLHLAHHEYPDADEEQQREPGNQDADDAEPAFLHRNGGDLHVVGAECLDQLGVVRRVGVEGGAVGVMAGDRVSLDRHILDLPGLDFGQELREREIGGGLPRRRPLKHLEQRHQDQADDDPQALDSCRSYPPIGPRLSLAFVYGRRRQRRNQPICAQSARASVRSVHDIHCTGDQ